MDRRMPLRVAVGRGEEAATGVRGCDLRAASRRASESAWMGRAGLVRPFRALGLWVAVQGRCPWLGLVHAVGVIQKPGRVARVRSDDGR